MGKINAQWFALLVTTSLVSASKLGDMASALPENAFVKFTGNASLNSLNLESSLLYWTNSGVWDPIKKQVRWMGGPGTCCSSSPVFKMITYDEVTDTWTVTPTPYTGSGHGYDGNTIN